MIDIKSKIDIQHAVRWRFPDADTAEQQRFAAMAAAGMDYAVMYEIRAATDALKVKLAANRKARRDACCA